MNELSLFTGAGGGVLGTKSLGWNSVGYVEFNSYCQQVIAQRIEDGCLDEAPIFGDIDHFIESGAAKKYQGYVDVVTAGFPCQPFSVAGNKKGKDDERNKWPQTIQCIRDVRPRYALLENVPGLLNSGYFGEILTTLAEAGFDAKWVVLGADDVGAPHRRKRLWIMAYTRLPVADPKSEPSHGINDHPGISMGREQVSQSGNRSWSNDVADSDSKGLEGQREESSRAGEELRNVSDQGWWPTEPNVGRVAHGVASRVDRLKAIGNGQVPAVAATAWRVLSNG